MATEFIGLTVLVKLKDPPNIALRGLVANVVGSTLFLTDVVTPTGHRLPEYSVEGRQIADLEIAAESPPQPRPEQPYNSVPHSGRQESSYNESQVRNAVPLPAPAVDVPLSRESSSRPTPRAQQFVDPAILSFGKRPLVIDADSLAAKVTQGTLAHATKPVVNVVHETVVTSVEKISLEAEPGRAEDEAAISSLTAPLDALGLNANVGDGDDTDELTIRDSNSRQASLHSAQPAVPSQREVEQVDTVHRKRGRGPKNKNRPKQPLAPITNHDIGTAEVTTPKSAREHNTNGSTRYKGSGWRQTPILEEAGAQPDVTRKGTGRNLFASTAPKTKRQRAMDREQARNGWATEDATDVQELGEFDFAGNLSKFDKRTVFDQIQTEDTTADEDRLVSYNRLPPSRPGTFGGKNLHPSEKVLGATMLHRGGGASSSTDSELDSGRNSGRRALSRSSLRRIPLRKDSQIVDEGVNAMTSSGSIHRSMRSHSRTMHTPSHATASPKPGRTSSPAARAASQAKPQFRIASSQRSCPTISPAFMTAVEEIAQSDFSLNEDILAENAARGIAEVTLTAINPGNRRTSRDSNNTGPVIVVLAGNNKTGARAVAAARHLQGRGLPVMVCVLGWDDSSPAYAQPRRLRVDLVSQTDRFEKIGGPVKGWPTTSAHLKTLDAPPELIIDALLGAHETFDVLSDDEQGEFLDVVAWANKSKACVLAVDVPSGIDGLTGKSSILEGEPLEIHAKFIVSVAAPKTGLLEAAAAGEGQGWQIFVVDVGVNAAWRKHAAAAGSKKLRAGVRFGSEWVVEIEFVEGGV